MFEAALLIPWLLIAAFWIFVIWAVLTLIAVLRDMLSELRGIREGLRAIVDRNGL